MTPITTEAPLIRSPPSPAGFFPPGLSRMGVLSLAGGTSPHGGDHDDVFAKDAI